MVVYVLMKLALIIVNVKMDILVNIVKDVFVIIHCVQIIVFVYQMKLVDYNVFVQMVILVYHQIVLLIIAQVILVLMVVHVSMKKTTTNVHAQLDGKVNLLVLFVFLLLPFFVL